MPTSSCVASQLCNVTLPTRLGLQPIALHPYTNLGNITLFWLSDYPTFAYIARAIQFSLELWVNSFSCLQYLLFAPNQREQARYHYQSKLFNICTRTPIGDLVGMVGLEPTTHFFSSHLSYIPISYMMDYTKIFYICQAFSFIFFFFATEVYD